MKLKHCCRIAISPKAPSLLHFLEGEDLQRLEALRMDRTHKRKLAQIKAGTSKAKKPLKSRPFKGGKHEKE